MTQRLSLVVAFRGTGWRRPFDDPVALEVWDQDHNLLAVIPASHVTALIRWQLTANLLQQNFAAYVGPPPPPLPRLTGASGRRLRGRKEPDHAERAPVAGRPPP